MEKTWNDGEAARAVDITNAFEKQVIHAQSSDGSGYLGKHVYRTDQELLKYYDGTGYHTYSKGQVGKGNSTGTGTGFLINTGSGEVNINVSGGTTVTISGLVAGERYEVHAQFLIAANTDNQVVNLKFYRDATQIGEQRSYCIKYVGAAFDQPCTFFEEFTATSSSHAFKFTIEQGIGAGSVQVSNGGGFVINHVGS